MVSESQSCFLAIDANLFNCFLSSLFLLIKSLFHTFHLGNKNVRFLPHWYWLMSSACNARILNLKSDTNNLYQHFVHVILFIYFYLLLLLESFSLLFYNNNMLIYSFYILIELPFCNIV